MSVASAPAPVFESEEERAALGRLARWQEVSFRQALYTVLRTWTAARALEPFEADLAAFEAELRAQLAARPTETFLLEGVYLLPCPHALVLTRMIPVERWDAHCDMHTFEGLIRVLGGDALPLLLALAGRHPTRSDVLWSLRYFRDPRIVPLVARGLAGREVSNARRHAAGEWLRRHGEVARGVLDDLRPGRTPSDRRAIVALEAALRRAGDAER